MAGDEASHILGWNIKNGWYPKGRPVTTPISLPRQRFHSIGAPGDGVPCGAFHKKANSGAYCDFPGRLRRKFGRVLPLPDNAPCHKPGTVREYLKKTNGDIQMRHFPPHAPEPSPAGNRPYEGAEGAQESISAMLLGKEIPIVKTFDYLAR